MTIVSRVVNCNELTDDQIKYHPGNFPFDLCVDKQDEYAEKQFKSGWRACDRCCEFFIGKKRSRKFNVLCSECKKEHPSFLREKKFWEKYDEKWSCF